MDEAGVCQAFLLGRRAAQAVHALTDESIDDFRVKADDIAHDHVRRNFFISSKFIQNGFQHSNYLLKYVDNFYLISE